jgi:beta-glucosidase/6-phospho-beta-glucosidase/beta-galactosidase
MAAQESIFPTFFLSGFECSTFVWKDQGRRNLVEETRHRHHADWDYGFLASLGIGVAREGIPWPLVDKGGGRYDFTYIDPFLEAMTRHKVLPIWDLCHYGYPDHCDPFREDFADCFEAYARAAAEYVMPRMRGPHIFTPMNEITFFGFMGGQWGWCAPFRQGRDANHALRRACCAADLRAVQVIRQLDREARFVHIDPLVNVVAPNDRPDLRPEARHETWEDTFYAWDILAGRLHPELGGSPEALDVVGVNCYSFGQMEYREGGPHKALPPDDPRILPLCVLLKYAWQRYRRPMIIAESSGLHDGREDWLRDVAEEALAAVREGMELHGVCLFPAVDMPDWHNGKWVKNGIADIDDSTPEFRRVPVQPYVDELRRWQRLFHRVEVLDEDPFDTPIDLADIRAAAERIGARTDKDWH